MNWVLKLVLIYQFYIIICLSSECPKLKNSRLSRNVIPIHYDLTLHVDLNKLIFNGNVFVSIQLKKRSNEITVHGKNLKINSAKLIDKAVELISEQIKYCEEEETVSFLFSKSIKGQWKLEINFTGNISTTRANGFYAIRRSNGIDSRYSLATDFQPNNARRAFPCFDEPNFKATYSISVVAPNDRTVVSNMPVSQKTPVSENEDHIMFQRSPKMSSYLVCIVVGDYDFIEMQSMDGRFPVRVYTPIGRQNEGKFTLEITIKYLDFLQKFLGVEYPLPKLDIITLRDMYIGGMENWGLITAREYNVLVNEKTPISVKQTVAYVIAHEVTHQWFGNLVTMNWWTHTWLNEGFASFFEVFLTKNFFKQWNYWTLFLADLYSSALETDSLRSSHPIVMKYLDEEELQEVALGKITYAKGASIVRMLYEWIGDKDFRLGLNRFINSHKYGNAGTDDLFRALHFSSNKNIERVMNGWFRQNGYPLLNVLNDNFKCIQSHVKQEKFSSDSNKSNEESKILWKIPVVYLFKNETFKFIMRRRERRLHSKCVSDWNVGSFGFYRTKYRDHEYKKLFNHASIMKISAEQRFALQNDYFAFAKAGIKSTVEYLEYLKLYINEDQLFIWQSIDKSISEINSLASYANCSKNMNDYIRKLYANVYKRLNSSKDKSDLKILLQVLVYKRLCFAGDEEIVNNAFNEFDRYYKEGKIFDPNFRGAIFQIVASNATDNIYEKFFELFRKNIDDAILRNELSSAIGFSSNRAQLEKALNFSISKDVTIFDSSTIISSVGGSFNGLAWDFFVKNFDFYKIRFEKESFIKGFVSQLNSYRSNEVKQFFKLNKFKGIKSTLRMSFEIIENREKWFKRDASNVCAYLKRF